MKNNISIISCSPRKAENQEANTAIHKLPSGDSPYVRAKYTQVCRFTSVYRFCCLHSFIFYFHFTTIIMITFFISMCVLLSCTLRGMIKWIFPFWWRVHFVTMSIDNINFQFCVCARVVWLSVLWWIVLWLWFPLSVSGVLFTCFFSFLLYCSLY